MSCFRAYSCWASHFLEKEKICLLFSPKTSELSSVLAVKSLVVIMLNSQLLEIFERFVLGGTVICQFL